MYAWYCVSTRVDEGKRSRTRLGKLRVNVGEEGKLRVDVYKRCMTRLKSGTRG